MTVPGRQLAITAALAAAVVAGQAWLPAGADAAPPAPTAPPGFTAVELSVGGPRAGRITAYLRRPAGEKPVPAIVALHGCGGLFTARGRLSARETDWADRLVAEGYAVLWPDSFNPRGYREICTLGSRERPIRPQHRAEDAAAALRWLATQPFIDAARLAVLGWSHGGSTTLWLAADGSATAVSGLRTAIAFYPGCRVPAERESYVPHVPLTVLIGSADDWTPPGPCRELAGRHKSIRLIEYPGAVHGFDAPGSPRRTRTDAGLSARGDGRVEVGTDPAARAAAIAEVLRILAAALR
jgi:dienelactone hydrolase